MAIRDTKAEQGGVSEDDWRVLAEWPSRLARASLLRIKVVWLRNLKDTPKPHHF